MLTSHICSHKMLRLVNLPSHHKRTAQALGWKRAETTISWRAQPTCFVLHPWATAVFICAQTNRSLRGNTPGRQMLRTRQVWKHPISYLLSTNRMCTPKPTMHHTNKYCVCHRAPLLKHINEPHWMTCSVITMNTHCSFLWLNPTYTILQPQTLTRAQEINPPLKIIPQQIHNFLLFVL